jgi:hypothetical protein
MNAYVQRGVIVAAVLMTFLGSETGCDRRSNTRPSGVTLLPKGRWELRVSDVSGRAIVAIATPIINGSRQSRDFSFDEFQRSPAIACSDGAGVIVLTRSESANAPAPLARNAWCIRVSAEGYSDKELDVLAIYESKSFVIPVILQQVSASRPE